mgnify:CR=1 FL=1
MRIYLATSWKNESVARAVAAWLRADKHEVDCFCEEGNRFVFRWTDIADDLMEHDAVTFLEDPRVQRAFLEDKKWIDWSQAVVMIMPCGRSAHLEAGYAKGKGKHLFIWGEFAKGEFDVMYGFADGVYRSLHGIGELLSVLRRLEGRPE